MSHLKALILLAMLSLLSLEVVANTFDGNSEIPAELCDLESEESSDPDESSEGDEEEDFYEVQLTSIPSQMAIFGQSNYFNHLIDQVLVEIPLPPPEHS